MEKCLFVERDYWHINMAILWLIVFEFLEHLNTLKVKTSCICLFAFGGLSYPRDLFYMGRWTTTMEGLDNDISYAKRILTIIFKVVIMRLYCFEDIIN